MPKLGSASLREANLSVVLRAEGLTRRQPHRGSEGFKYLEEHSSLDGNLKATGDVEALEQLGHFKLQSSTRASLVPQRREELEKKMVQICLPTS